MFELEGFGCIRKLPWRAIRPGMVLLSEIRVNDAVPCELRGFPVLTRELFAAVTARYRLLPDREVLVAHPADPGAAARLAASIRRAEGAAGAVNALRAGYFAAKGTILRELGLPPDADVPILGSPAVDGARLVKDRYASLGASFALPQDCLGLPSFFGARGLEVTLADILAGRADRVLALPRDEELMLHLVVDYSLSMRNRGRLVHVLETLRLLTEGFLGLLGNTRRFFYAFSDECRELEFPFGEAPIPSNETNYAAFVKKVLHRRDRTLRNKVILFTDGVPSDRGEARAMLALLRKNKVDFTQIVFNLAEEYDELVDDDAAKVRRVDGLAVNPGELVTRRTTPEERERLKAATLDEFTALAELAGGNQVVLNIDRAMRYVAVEVYDRYLGLLSLAPRME